LFNRILLFSFVRQQVIIDPEEKEESIVSGTLMMAFNIHHEICCAQMSGGVCLDYEQVSTTNQLPFYLKYHPFCTLLVCD